MVQSLWDYFEAAAIKSLSAVEVDPKTSNQHEFNGIKALVEMLGIPHGKVPFPAQFIYIDDDVEPDVTEGSVTWYDARENTPNRTEYRLYYTKNEAMIRATEADTLIIAKRKTGEILVVVAKSGSQVEAQLCWLFGKGDKTSQLFELLFESELQAKPLGYSAKLVLESLGLPSFQPDSSLEAMVVKEFGGVFPTTDQFSTYARGLSSADPINAPDIAILAWMELEEQLFRALEKHQVDGRLAQGFNSAEELITYSLSLHQRRKSRAGYALENHLSRIFDAHEIYFDRGKVTEGKTKPDFIFPTIIAYHNQSFSASGLTMLGCKSTCKDRWRQILREAERIPAKHLFTLEAPITVAQTDEMRGSSVTLVIPSSLHVTFNKDQQKVLSSLADFLEMLKEKEEGFAGTAMGFG